MKKNYTFNAIRISNKYPLLSSIGKQGFFWIIAYSLLFTLLYLNSITFFTAMGESQQTSLAPSFLLIIFLGIFFGVALGLIDDILKRRFFVSRPLGISILIGSLLYFIVLMLMINISKYVILDLSGELFISKNTRSIVAENWKYYNYILMLYTFFMTLMMSFINQMNKKFGPGMLLPFLFGRFRYPREEERIFMFLDLTSSTKLAEKLGHVKYSALIQQSFLDINIIVKKYNAEIYQYVGDEIVISWPSQQFQNFAPIAFFFAVQEHFKSREEFYGAQFGIHPGFKAGVHKGMVTAVEVGDVKRDIAYHGDTLNVASRLENLCHTYQSSILISGAVKQLGNNQDEFHTTSLGFQNLEGRQSPIEIFSVQKTLKTGY